MIHVLTYTEIQILRSHVYFYYIDTPDIFYFYPGPFKTKIKLVLSHKHDFVTDSACRWARSSSRPPSPLPHPTLCPPVQPPQLPLVNPDASLGDLLASTLLMSNPPCRNQPSFDKKKKFWWWPPFHL